MFLVNCREAAQRLSISARALWTLTKTGEIAHVRAGRRVLYAPADLLDWIARNRSCGVETLN